MEDVNTLAAHAARMVASCGGADRVFMLAQYAITLALPSLAARRQTSALAIVAASPKGAVVATAVPTLDTYLRLKKIRDLLSDYRIFARLVGYPAMHAWAVDVAAKPRATLSEKPGGASISTTRRTPQWIEDVQVLANLAYQPMENVAYLSSHDVLPISKQLENKLWLWSCRCWATHVFLELYRLSIEYESATSRQRGATKQSSKAWWRELAINLAYAPLTLHWSVDGGIGLDEAQVGLLGVVAAVGQLTKAWEASA